VDIATIAARAPVIPVLTIERPADAVPLGRALVKGGLPVLEITLRTPAALEALRLIAAEVEGAIAGAGTVLYGSGAGASPGGGILLTKPARDRPAPTAAPGVFCGTLVAVIRREAAVV